MWNAIELCDNDEMNYQYEIKRLQSFKNWPAHFIRPEKMAAAGFYYTGQLDKVKCFECQLEMSHWIKEDNPMVVHQRWLGLCRFVRKIPCGNVAIGADPNTILSPPSSSMEDLPKLYHKTYRSNTISDNFTNGTTEIDCLGYTFPTVPKFPEYATYEARLSTFRHWPKPALLTGERLADAGFFYTKKEDQTQCYHCGGSLNNWEIDEDPWEKHWMWFPNCYHL